MNPETDIGPLVNPSSLKEVLDQVKDALDCGAQLLCGCKAIEGPGCFFTTRHYRKNPNVC